MLGQRGAGGDDRQRVREASDIVDVIGEVVTLKPKGREFGCLCPFHDDHNPSMYVVPGKQIFHCFVCGAGGDVFTFVQRFHKMEFREALEFLAQRAGIELTPWGGTHGGAGAGAEGKSEGASRGDLFGVNARAAGFFRAVLTHPEHGEAARGVIARRGISAEMVERFGLGAAPDRWDGLVLFARKQGLSEEELGELGLVKRREGGSGVYDALRHRLVFPIHDQTGRVVAFGGRKIRDEDEPKYLNSPETRLFDKSATLYGLHQAARAIQKERRAIVVEGYTDVIACHQAGVCNVVGTLGTALTAMHARALRRMCDEVVLLFDGDDAGRRAARRAVEVFFREPVDLRVASLGMVTELKDPDELLKTEGGRGLFEEAVGKGRELLGYLFDELRERLRGGGLSERSRVIGEWLAWLGTMGWSSLEPVRRRLVLQRLIEVTGLDEQTVRAALPSGRGGSAGGSGSGMRGGSAAASTEDGPRVVDGAGELAIGCVLGDGALYERLTHADRDLLSGEGLGHEASRRVADVVHRLGEDGVRPGLAAVLDELSADEAEAEAGRGGGSEAEAWGRARTWAARIFQRVEDEVERSGERRERLLMDVVARLRGDAKARELAERELAGREGGGEAAVLERLKARAEAEVKARGAAAGGGDGVPGGGVVNRRARLFEG